MSSYYGEDLRPGELIPNTHFTFECVLGRGGYGTALLVRDPVLGSRLVLKVLESIQAPEAVGRFQREGQILRRLDHPAIVKVFHADVIIDPHGGGAMRILPYVAMEYLEGETLAALLDRRGALPVVEALSMMAELLDGIEAAHKIDVVHRDLKPQNVILARIGSGRELKVKLLDFGIAKLTQEEDGAPGRQLTVKGAILGTPRYLSPEQVEGTAIGPYTDIYSAAVVLFLMLTGRTPFEGDLEALFRQHLFETPPRLASIGAGGPFSPELENLVAAQLAKKPHERLQRATDFASALRNIARQYVDTYRSAPVSVDAPTLSILNPQAIFNDVTAVRSAHWPTDGSTVRAAPASMPPADATIDDPKELTEQAASASASVAPPTAPARVVVPTGVSHVRRRNPYLLAGAAFLAGGLVVGITLFGRRYDAPATKASTFDSSGANSTAPPAASPPPGAATSALPLAAVEPSAAPSGTVAPAAIPAPTVSRTTAPPEVKPPSSKTTSATTTKPGAKTSSPPVALTMPPVASPPPAKSVSAPTSAATGLDPSGFDDRK